MCDIFWPFGSLGQTSGTTIFGSMAGAFLFSQVETATGILWRCARHIVLQKLKSRCIESYLFKVLQNEKVLFLRVYYCTHALRHVSCTWWSWWTVIWSSCSTWYDLPTQHWRREWIYGIMKFWTSRCQPTGHENKGGQEYGGFFFSLDFVECQW